MTINGEEKIHVDVTCKQSSISGFPPIRENFENFYSQGKTGFSAKIKEKISNRGHFPTVGG